MSTSRDTSIPNYLREAWKLAASEDVDFVASLRHICEARARAGMAGWSMEDAVACYRVEAIIRQLEHEVQS
jgi:hypothetical protein